jgi:DNA-binding IscR family transcriptional regulator
VLRAVEGPEALSIRPVPRGPPGLATGATARALHNLWTDAEHAVTASLDQVTLEDLVRRVQQASGSTDYSI